MNAFSEWLRKLGALHDAVVKSFSWRPGSQVLEVDFEDIYQNFEGLPEYPGAQAGTVVLHGVTHLTVDVDSGDTLHVREFFVGDTKGATGQLATISFWPHGKIVATFVEAHYPECHLLPTSAD